MNPSPSARNFLGVMPLLSAAYLHEKLKSGLICVAHLQPVKHLKRNKQTKRYMGKKRLRRNDDYSFESGEKCSSSSRKAGSSAHIFRCSNYLTQTNNVAATQAEETPNKAVVSP